MGTEVLRPEDCLGERFLVSPSPFHRRKDHFATGNGFYKNYGYRKRRFNNQLQQGDQEVKPEKRLSSGDDLKATRRNNNSNFNRSLDSHNRDISNTGSGSGTGPVVTLLRRGVSLDSINSKIKRDNRSTLSKKMEEQHKADVYAGSAFSFSPSPRSLPLPSFFIKKESKSFDDSATRDLRRLLRLE